MKGGPVLHRDDLPLFEKKILSQDNLVVIRQGEPAYNPIKEIVEPAPSEMVKIGGKGANWECIFYDPSRSTCTIHPNRPVECRLLKCWDIDDIKDISGKYCLTRYDLIPEGDPLVEYIEEHEKRCCYPTTTLLLDQLLKKGDQEQTLPTLQTIMSEDLAVREQAVNRLHLTLKQELFYFGRPMFQVIKHPGLAITIVTGEIQLSLS